MARGGRGERAERDDGASSLPTTASATTAPDVAEVATTATATAIHFSHARQEVRLPSSIIMPVEAAGGGRRRFRVGSGEGLLAASAPPTDAAGQEMAVQRCGGSRLAARRLF